MLYGLPPFYSRETSEMYNNILQKPLRLKPSASLAAQDILVKLLQKNKQLRLGSISDFQEVRKQTFFISVDWRLLDQRRIEPPFKPKVMSPLSTEYIDSEFTREPVP
uniref:AGC-kinase C-terminal domain-containing protein n=1 Tax=Macrostomum lignano TaxID=282301 RepID=A0A1I8HD33_9PLAT